MGLETALESCTELTSGGWLSQVRFAGVHSNIGGGYPEDGLSYISLAWMIMEAQKKGLRFHPAAVSSIKSTASPYARMYNSRAGFGAYYPICSSGFKSTC